MADATDTSSVNESESSQDEWEPECKLKKTENNCIVHCSDKPGKLIPVKTLKQWNELVDAAKKLENTDVLEIQDKTPPGAIPENISYHKNCRNSFLLRSSRKQSKSNQQSSDETSKPLSKSPKRKRATRVASSKVLLSKECIFCRKMFIY